MAKQKGFIKLQGSLGGLTFYESGGNSIVKTTGGVDKSRINNDPNYKRTRDIAFRVIFGWAARIRTWTKSFKVTDATVTSLPNIIPFDPFSNSII